MIDLIILLMYLALASAVVATIWAVVRTARTIGRTSGKVHGVSVRRINITTWTLILLAVLFSATCLSTSPMHINAATYSDTFWLRIANTCVFTSTFAITLAALATVYNIYKARR